MKGPRIFILITASLLLLAISTGGIYSSNADRQENHAAAVRSNGMQMVKINNVKMGESIKHQLDTQPEISLIFHNKKDTSHYHDHEAAVDFIKNPSAKELDRITRDIRGWVVKEQGTVYIFRSTFMETSQMLSYFNKQANTEFAEPNFILMQNETNLPNDLLYKENYQWNLPVIGTEQGWDVTRGKENIEIAIVDTGVDLDHPELKNRLVKGFNLINESQEPDDDNGHGTHVAGIIASETNNNEGIAGMTWFNKIMPVKAMGAKGYGTTFDIARGIIWAVDHGADVINLSLGNYQPSKVLEEAVTYAFSKNVVMVSAAGNDGSNQPTYPSAYPEVMSVAAIDYDGKRANFSNYGEYIDIAAPGVYIPSTYYKKQYAALSGTSMAAPHVAGLAALIISAQPQLTNKQVMNIIMTSAIDLGERGKDDNFGNGLIDVNSALQKAKIKKSEYEQNKFNGRLFNYFR